MSLQQFRNMNVNELELNESTEHIVLTSARGLDNDDDLTANFSIALDTLND